MQEKINEIIKEKAELKKRAKHNQDAVQRWTESVGQINWIEQLLQTPISDYRKYCCWRILAPYFVNVKKQSIEEAYHQIMTWLTKCNDKNRLSFYPQTRIKYDVMNAAKHGYYPINLIHLQQDNPELYYIIVR